MNNRVGLIIILIILLVLPVSARFSVSGSGGLIYPGFKKSPNFESRFIAGPGFEFSIQHTMMNISADWPLLARYSVRNYYADISLPFVETANFKFNYFAIELYTELGDFIGLEWYAGAGAALANASASKDFTQIDDTAILPQLFVGARYPLGHDFAAFGEALFQDGGFESTVDTIPVTGMRLALGLTMYISD